MRKRTAFMIAAIAILAVAAVAQNSRSSIALEGTGLFTADNSGHDAFQSPVTRHVDTTGGLLLSYRYRLWSWLSLEASYGLGSNALQFTTSTGVFTGNAFMHQITTDVVVKLRSGERFKPYVLMGGGALLFSPTSGGFTTPAGFSSNPPATRVTQSAFLYGGGADFPVKQRWSLRAEYRGLLYQDPDFGVPTLGTGNKIHTAEPSFGVVYRF